MEARHYDPFYRMSVDAINSSTKGQNGNIPSRSSSSYSYKNSQQGFDRMYTSTNKPNSPVTIPWYSQYRRPSVGTVLGASSPSYGAPARSTFSSTWSAGSSKDQTDRKEDATRSDAGRKEGHLKEPKDTRGSNGGFFSMFTSGPARKRVPLSTDL